jgi:DNA-binding NarL/FixJ family response regulator
MTCIRVVIADDHTLVRAGFRSILAEWDDVEVVAEAGDGLEALAQVALHRPDILLADIDMPGLNGLVVAARVAQEYPGTRTVILSMHGDEEYVRRAMTAGVSAYLLKESDTEELRRALHAVAGGHNYLSPAVATHLVSGYRRQTSTEAGRDAVMTARQREILTLIAEGHNTKAIARRLEISVKTVETHRTQLMNRLGIHDIAGLVRYAIRKGMVSPSA